MFTPSGKSYKVYIIPQEKKKKNIKIFTPNEVLKRTVATRPRYN